MPISVKQIDLHVLNMRTRMPFQYGIATLTALPHLFVRATVDVDGATHTGVAADGLPPKWFTKDPASHFREDLADMFEVIRKACELAQAAGPADTVFDWWRSVYAAQQAWAADTKHPPLLWAFGVSLVERAVIEAHCRASGATFGQVLRANTLGVRLGEIYPELGDAQPADLLPAASVRRAIVRHTVGLADPLLADEIPDGERIRDGLPQALDECIRAYGLTHFKIKIRGDADVDMNRLRRIRTLLRAEAGPSYVFTLDGNEQYPDVGAFREFWETIHDDGDLREMMSRLIAVEQPVHRDAAFDVDDALLSWDERPPIIIDEADGELHATGRALELGYAGTSHKNCKGVFKGAANACLIAHRRRTDASRPYRFTGEDLANVGPVALLQDLAVMGALGIEHIERNGHHYFRGLSMIPGDVNEKVLEAHGDLYRRHEDGFPTLAIERGILALGSVIDAPFGVGLEIDPSRHTPLDAWTYDTLDKGS